MIQGLSDLEHTLSSEHPFWESDPQRDRKGEKNIQHDASLSGLNDV
jgi:hypothetical protein